MLKTHTPIIATTAQKFKKNLANLTQNIKLTPSGHRDIIMTSIKTFKSYICRTQNPKKLRQLEEHLKKMNKTAKYANIFANSTTTVATIAAIISAANERNEITITMAFLAISMAIIAKNMSDTQQKYQNLIKKAHKKALKKEKLK